VTTAEANKAVAVEGFQTLFGRGDYAAADEFYAPHARLHSPGEPDGVESREQLKDFARRLREGFPDLRIEIEDVVAEGDKVVLRCVASGSHTGRYRGLPPTGRTFTVSQMVIFRLEDGKLAEAWQEIDALGLARQLGVVSNDGVGPFGLLGWTFRTIGMIARAEVRDRAGSGKRQQAD
jgi:steroid delta-isomerase-like uncharacterized protein